MFFEKKLLKNLEGIENSCTFASAFAQKNQCGGKKNFQSSERKTSSFGFPSREGSQGRKALKSSLKDLHRQK